MVVGVEGQRTGFNTLDNWGHKTPTQSKRIKDRKERLKVMARNMYTIHSVTSPLLNHIAINKTKGCRATKS